MYGNAHSLRIITSIAVKTDKNDKHIGIFGGILPVGTFSRPFLESFVSGIVLRGTTDFASQ